MSSEAVPTDSQTAPPAANEATWIFLKDGTRTTIDSGRISLHDFRNRTGISQADLRDIEALYQRYIRNLGARLSIFLRMECSLKLGKLSGYAFSRFCELMAAPSCISLFAIDQMRGVGILDVSLPLALSMADRLLGGKGRAPADERALTEIETALLDDVMQIIITGWADFWSSEELRLHPRIIGQETSGRCLQTAPAEEVFVVLLVEMTIGETTGHFQIGIPFSLIELPMRKLGQNRDLGKEDRRAKPVQWRKPYAGIGVPILAEWKVREMPLSETLRISKGDIIELPGALINHARLRLAEVETFVGTVGIQNGHVAVQITGPVGND